MSVKICSICGIEKNLTDFYVRSKKDGIIKYRKDCKECVSNRCATYYQDHQEEIIERSLEYYENNKETVKEAHKIYVANNKESVAAYQKQYQQDNKTELKIYRQEYTQKNKEEIAITRKEYLETHKEETNARQNAYVKNKYHSDPIFRMKSIVSASIRNQLKSSKNGDSCMDYLPYTIEELWIHLESQFEPWMTRENNGVYNAKTWNDNDDSTKTWQLDHIQPHSDFPYTSMEDQLFKDCWKLSNLRPYSAKQNQKDGATRIRHKEKK